MVPASRLAALIVGLATLASFPFASVGRAQEKLDAPVVPMNSAVNTIEVKITDGSTLFVRLREQRVEMQTNYGKLFIPVGDVQRIEFGMRIPEELARKIESAINNLGHPMFRVREAAQTDLFNLREKALPALLQAAKSSDAEVAKRAEDILTRLKETYQNLHTDQPTTDVVYTADCKLTGKILQSTFLVSTTAFGDQQLKLSDVRSLRSTNVPPADSEAVNALPDPGNLVNYQAQIGKTLVFRVTGAQGGGNLWGTDTYTTDSNLAMAAVHCGLLQPGQTGVVKVTILPSPQAFFGSTRNGITSQNYGVYNAAFRVNR